MVVFNSLSTYATTNPTALTIGSFDGLHLGHKAILKRLVEYSKDKKIMPTVLTFLPHPRIVLGHQTDILSLNTLEEKREILKTLGIKQLIIHPFTKEFSATEPEKFVEKYLVKTLNAKYIAIGHNHRFGRDGKASAQDLINLGGQYGFFVDRVCPQLSNDGNPISSTKVRTYLSDGKIEDANGILGYNYTLSGEVVKGDGIGKKIGFPTANLKIIEPSKMIPKDGVYLIKTSLEKIPYYGMMNIGKRPTVKKYGERRLECHFLDFKTDIYHQKISVEVIKRIRNEQKFGSLEKLKSQLETDKQTLLLELANL